MPLVQVQQGEPFKHCSGSAFLLLETRLKLRGEVGGKACEAPPVAEEANRVWRCGRLFVRIRAKKDGNRKRKRDTAHDGVGSSGAGEPFKHCLCSAFLLFETLNTELRSRWQSLRSAAGGGKSEQGLAQRSAFCENTSRKRREPQEEA